MEDSSFETLRQRVKEYIQAEDPRDAIANIEDELEDILEQLFDELSTPKDTPIPGNAQILHSAKGGYIIQTDEGQQYFMHKTAYKGENTQLGTKIICGKFRTANRGEVCVDAQECISLNELRYSLFSYIEDGDIVKAASAAWAIYKDASPLNQEKMKFCIHALRNYMKTEKVKRMYETTRQTHYVL